MGLLWGALILGACASHADKFFPSYGQAGPAPGDFTVCHGYGCATHSEIHLTDQEWAEVESVFSPPATSAAEERRTIARAVALLQHTVGLRTGTSAHQRRALVNAGDATQLDCIDETVNTETYLTMIERDHLLNYHRVEPPAHAGSLLTFDLRNTAALVETATGAVYAVDPTLVDATVPTPIVPMSLWRASSPPVIPAEFTDAPTRSAGTS